MLRRQVFRSQLTEFVASWKLNDSPPRIVFSALQPASEYQVSNKVQCRISAKYFERLTSRCMQRNMAAVIALNLPKHAMRKGSENAKYSRYSHSSGYP